MLTPRITTDTNITHRGWVVCLAFMFISILLTAGEIGLSFAHALHPWTFLGIQVFKSTFWIIYFAVGIITTVAQRGIESNLIWTAWQIWQAVGISLALVIILAALVYGSVVVHKYRKTGKLGLEADFVGVEKGHGLEPPRERAIMGDVPWPER